MSRTIKQKKTGGKAVSRHCKNHGGCEYCYSDRLIHTLKELDRTSIKYDPHETEYQDEFRLLDLDFYMDGRLYSKD